VSAIGAMAVSLAGVAAARAGLGLGDDASAALPPCAGERHVVVFDVFHLLTLGDPEEHEIVAWIRDPSDEPDERPGAVELVRLYRALGYEIMYVHAAPGTIVIDAEPVSVAIAGWLDRHGFPVGAGTHVFTWTPTSEADDFITAPLTVMSEALQQLGIEEVDVRFGYSGIVGRVEAFLAGGISPDRIFTLGEAAGVEGTTAIPGGDLNAHVGVVRATADAVCEPPFAAADT
jgi:hypothetical protein